MNLLDEMIKETTTFLALKAVDPDVFKAEQRLERKMRGLFNKAFVEVERQLKLPGGLGNPTATTAAILAIEDELTALIIAEALNFVDVPRTVTGLLANQAFNASTKTLQRVRGNVIESLVESFELADGIGPASRRLREEFTNMRDFELQRIARTEINGAQSLSTYIRFLDQGVTFHEWITTIDGKQRSSHEGNHRVITRVGGTFPNGQKHPHDRSVAIEEWISCRCDAVPFLVPLNKFPPPGMGTFKESDLITVKAA